MNIDFNTHLKSVYGADLIGPDTKVNRLGTVCVNALTGVFEDEKNLSGDDNAVAGVDMDTLLNQKILCLH